MKARRRSVFRITLKAALAVLLLLVFTVIVFVKAGMPRPFIALLERAADRRGYALDVERAWLTIPAGIRLDGVRLFRKGQIGPPGFEAGTVAIRAGLLSFPRWHVDIYNGIFRRYRGARTQARKSNGSDGTGVTTRIRLVDCVFQDLVIKELAFEKVRLGRRVFLFGMNGLVGGVAGAGSFKGWLAYDAEARDYWGRFDTGCDVRELADFIDVRGIHGLANFVRSFDFRNVRPRVEAGFKGGWGDGWSCMVRAAFRGKNMSYNRIDIAELDGEVAVDVCRDDMKVELRDLAISREEGRADLDFTIDLLARTVDFAAESTLDPEAAARLIHRKGPDYLELYEFYGPVSVSTRGTVCYTNEAYSRIHGAVELERATMGKYTADSANFEFDRIGRATAVSNIVAVVSGGAVKGDAYFSPAAVSGVNYRVTAEFNDVDLKEFSDAAFPEVEKSDGYTGRLSGRVDVSGTSGKGMEWTTTGTGSIRIKDGRILRLPLFGDLSHLLAKLVPGLDYVLRQNEARCTYRIVEGRMKTDDLKIEGDILSLKAEGEYDLARKEMDFDVELRFLKSKTFVGGIVQTIFLPVSRLLKVDLTGTPSDPQWTALNF